MSNLWASQLGTTVHGNSRRKKEEQIVKILDRDNIRREKQRRNYEFTSIPGLISKLSILGL